MERKTIIYLSTLLVLLVVGCGGSGGSGSGGSGGGGGGSSNIPTLVTLVPSSATAGTPAITLNVNGSGFIYGATVNWSGSPLTTTFISATQLTAAVPAANLASTANINVTVTNPSPGGGTSSSLAFTVAAAPAPATWIRQVTGVTNPKDIAWDSVHGKLYVSIASTDPTSPNTIIPVDPVAGTAGTPVAAGNGPNLLSIASNSAYLWVGLDGDNAVQRFLLPGLTKDISFPVPSIGSTAQQAFSLEAAPVSPHAVAIVAGTYDGVYVYDDATQRPVSVPGWGPGGGPLIDWVQWAADDSTLYGTQYATIDTGGLWKLNVTASGVTWTPGSGSSLSPGAGRYDKMSGLLYAGNLAFDPVNNVQAGLYTGPSTSGPGLNGGGTCTVNSSLSRFYCVGATTSVGSGLWVFNQNTYDFIQAFDLGSTISGSPMYMIPWGNAGLALLTSGLYSGTGGLYLIDGAAINPNATPDASTGTSVSSLLSLISVSPSAATAGGSDVQLAVTGTGFTQSSVIYSDYNYYQGVELPTTFVSSTQLTATLPASAIAKPGPLTINVWDDFSSQLAVNSLGFTVYPSSGSTQITAVDLSGLDLAWEANSALLYVGTNAMDSAYPNSIVAVDPTTGRIVRTQPVGTDPDLLSVSSDGSYLFAAYAGATTMTELALPGLNASLTWGLNNPLNAGPFFAGDMKAAPQSPHTTAVTLFNPNFTPQAQGGVVIYDDKVQRPTFAPGWNEGQTSPALYNTLAWSNSDHTLASAAGYGPSPLYALIVDTSGASFFTAYSAFNETGEIHSDFGTGLIYSDDGRVASPFDGSFKGSYGASGLVVPDSANNRVYILGQTAAQEGTSNYTIESFNQSTFAPISSIVVSNIFDSPFRMVRWGNSGLAVLTSYNSHPSDWGGPAGMLYILTDSTFVSGGQPARSSEAKPQELVQLRWKRPSTKDFVRRAQQRTAGHSD